MSLRQHRKFAKLDLFKNFSDSDLRKYNFASIYKMTYKYFRNYYCSDCYAYYDESSSLLRLKNDNWFRRTKVV